MCNFRKMASHFCLFKTSFPLHQPMATVEHFQFPIVRMANWRREEALFHWYSNWQLWVLTASLVPRTELHFSQKMNWDWPAGTQTLHWNIFSFLLTFQQQQKRLYLVLFWSIQPRPRLAVNPAVQTGFWFRPYRLDHRRTVSKFCTCRADPHGMRPVKAEPRTGLPSSLKWSVWAGDRV